MATILLSVSGCHKKGDNPTVAPPVRVAVTVVGDHDSRLPSTFSGTVASGNTATVSFAVAGTIENLYAEEGQRVRQGQLIGSLKDGDYVNANNMAQAQLAEARDAYTRLKKLHDANALPDIKWVEMEQKLKQAQNAAEIAARALSETKIYAPMTGVISRKIADKGQNVAPIEPIFEIVSTDVLTIDIFVPENEVAKFKVGQTAMISDNESATYEGKVSRKSVVADPLTRSYKVTVALPSTAAGRLLPGMVTTVSFAAAESPVAETKETFAALLPSQAVVLNDDNRTFVWIVRNGKAERRFVESDAMAAKGIIVKSGLQPGDTVIVAGMQKVGTGSTVECIVAND